MIVRETPAGTSHPKRARDDHGYPSKEKLFRPDSGERIVIAPASTPVDAVAVTRKGAMQDLFDSKIVLALHEMGVLADLYLSMLDTLLSAAFRSVGVSLPPPSKPPPRRMPTRRLLRELLECS